MVLANPTGMVCQWIGQRTHTWKVQDDADGERMMALGPPVACGEPLKHTKRCVHVFVRYACGHKTASHKEGACC